MPTTASAVLGTDADLLDDTLTEGLDDLPEVEEVESDDGTGESDTPDSDLAESEEGEPGATDEPDGEEIVEEEVPDEDEVSEEGDEELVDGSPRTQARMRDLSARAARAAKFEPILEMLENDPDMAREIIAKRLGLTPRGGATEPAARPAGQGAPAGGGAGPTQEQVTAYWNEELKKDPAKTLVRMISWVNEQQNAPVAQRLASANVETLVENFKGRMASADPQRWPHYEPYFDALLDQTDPNTILQSPKQTLQMLKRMAFGTWAEEQTERATKARAKVRAKPAQQGRRNALTRGTGAGGAGGRQATRTRQLSEEEQELVRRYGDLALPEEGE